MAFIRLDRPLAVFDIEATGLNPRTDRIVELSVVRVPVGGGEPETRTWLLDPTVPIPIETTAIHGICDDMVKGCPTFADKADEILAFFRGCDLGGFGIGHLDVPILEEEFARAAAGAAAESATVVILRKPGRKYSVSFEARPVQAVAKNTKSMPDAFIAANGHDVTPAFLAWARPLAGPLPPCDVL